MSYRRVTSLHFHEVFILNRDFSPEYEPPYKGPVAQRGNGMAVASLVCGVLFCFVITAPLAVILGIMSC